MYTILICDDNSLITTKYERIMQRSKLVDNLQFLVHKIYNEEDMSDYTVQLEYILPHSKKYRTEILKLSDKMYKENYLKYLLPFDTKLTSEHGEIEIQLTFVKTELDIHGNDIQRVRKTSTTKINIVPISAWSDIIPDSALSAIDERLIKLDAQMRGIDEYLNVLDNNMIDDLTYDKTNETLKLSSKGVEIGNGVSMRNIIKDGIPVVDLDSNNDDDNFENNDNKNDCNCEDNVIEFGYSQAIKSEDDDNVIEF